MQVTQTPRKSTHPAKRGRFIAGWVIIVMAAALTAFTAYSAYDYATGEFEGADAAVMMFIVLVAAVLALIGWSVGLLMVLSDRTEARRRIRMVLIGALVVAVLGAVVLMALASG